jgi:hypothetical protein
VTYWFGEPWPSAEERAPVCEDDQYRTNTPVFERCLYCLEPIVIGDRGVALTAIEKTGPRQAFAHIECQMRQAFGGPAHIQGTCSCAGGPDDPDMGMTYREAALWVWDWVTARGAV